MSIKAQNISTYHFEYKSEKVPMNGDNVSYAVLIDIYSWFHLQLVYQQYTSSQSGFSIISQLQFFQQEDNDRCIVYTSASLQFLTSI